MGKITTSQFEKGMFIEFKNEIHQISEFQFVNPGKGSAFVRTKLRNIKSGNSLEFTYKSGETVNQVSVFVKEMQYLFKTEDIYTFMDPESFEQYVIKGSLIGNFKNYLKEGEIYQLFLHENNLLGLRSPKKVKLMVKEAEEGAKGNTVSGARKSVRLETGIEIQVPLFIKNGDIIAINPDTGEYLERVN